MAAQPFPKQLGVLVGISALMTVGVYGLVAGIVKIDDFGLWLQRKASAAAQAVGRALLAGAPWLMKFLSVAGTVAMFLVGGSIFVHNVPVLHHAVQDAAALAGGASGVVGTLLEALIGVLLGAVVLAAVEAFKKLRR